LQGQIKLNTMPQKKQKFRNEFKKELKAESKNDKRDFPSYEDLYGKAFNPQSGQVLEKKYPSPFFNNPRDYNGKTIIKW